MFYYQFLSIAESKTELILTEAQYREEEEEKERIEMFLRGHRIWREKLKCVIINS